VEEIESLHPLVDVILTTVITMSTKKPNVHHVTKPVKHVLTTYLVLLVQKEELKVHSQTVLAQMVNLKILQTNVKIVLMNVLHVQEVQIPVLNVTMLEKVNQLVNVQMVSMILMESLLVEFVKSNVILVPDLPQTV